MKHRTIAAGLVVAVGLAAAAVVASQSQSPAPSVPTSAFEQRYASPDEIAPVATLAALNCGKPYFGTYCRLPDGTYGCTEGR